MVQDFLLDRYISWSLLNKFKGFLSKVFVLLCIYVKRKLADILLLYFFDSQVSVLVSASKIQYLSGSGDY